MSEQFELFADPSTVARLVIAYAQTASAHADAARNVSRNADRPQAAASALRHAAAAQEAANAAHREAVGCLTDPSATSLIRVALENAETAAFTARHTANAAAAYACDTCRADARRAVEEDARAHGIRYEHPGQLDLATRNVIFTNIDRVNRHRDHCATKTA